MGTGTLTGRTPIPYNSFNYKYLFTGIYQIYELKKQLCDTTFFNDFGKLFQNDSDFVNSIKYYPFSLNSLMGFQSEPFYIGKRWISSIGSVPAVKEIYKRVLIGTVRITPKYNNFMDYEPYTHIQLYVPYFGFFSLPTNEVMNKTVYIYLSVDFDTGIGTIYVEVEGRVLMVNTNKIGIDIPIGASNLNEVIKQNVGNALKTVAGAVMLAFGGAGGKLTGAMITTKGIGMAINSGVDAVTNSTVRYTRGTLSGGSDALASPTSIYAVITRPNAIPIDSRYNAIKGKPLGEIKALSQLRGFTKVDDIHLTTLPNALEDEVTEIETLLKDGVEL